MCSILNYAEDKGRQEGFKEGFQEGFQKAFQEAFQEAFQKKGEEIIVNALKAGFPTASIIQLGFTENDVKTAAYKNNLHINP